jgi:O-antigen ligase/tetratricopeptide (TPR) repeat protein
MQNSIRKVVFACLLIIPFLALHVADGGVFDVLRIFSGSGMFFPFISGKNILFRVLVEIAFAGWAVLALSDSSYRVSIKKSPIMIAYGLFIIVLLFADLFGVDMEKSMWSNFERMEGFVGHIHFFAYFFVLTVMVRTLQEWQRMWKYFIAADLLVLLYAFGQLFGAKGTFFAVHFPKMATLFSSKFPIHMSFNRLDATIGNSAYFAVFCLMYIFIAALLWSQSPTPKKQWFYPLVIFLNLIGLFYSGTRGTMIGVLVGGFITLGIIAWKEKGKMRKFFAGVTVALLVLVSAVFVFKNTSFIQTSPTLSRFASISFKDVTGASRLSIWKISYEAWKEKPILGYGQDNFSYIFARKFLPEKMCNLEPWYDRSHDVFFDWLVAAGALGLITYLSLYAVTLWFMWKRENMMTTREKAILTGMIAGYFIHNIFVFDNLTSYILFFATLAYITTRTKAGGEHHGKVIFDKDQMNLLVLPVIGIALLVALYYINIRPLVVNRLVIRAMSVVQSQDPKDQTIPFADRVKIQQDSFVQAIAMNTLGSMEGREQFMQMVVRMAQIKIPDTLSAGEKQADVQALNGLLTSADKEVKDSYDRYKDDVRMLSIYGMFYNGIGNAPAAEKILTEAHTIAPNKQLIAFDLIRSQLLQKKMQDAYALGKETYDLSITCNDALKWYLLSAAYAGHYKEAKAYAISKGQTPALDPDVIAGVIASGQTSLAIELLQETKKANPSLAPQIDQYINQVLAPKK